MEKETMCANTRSRAIVFGTIAVGFTLFGFNTRQDDTLIIRDSEGRVRMRIGRLGESDYGMLILDSAGQVRGRLTYSETTDSTEYDIRDGSSARIASLIGAPDGTGSIRLGSAQKPRAELFLRPDGTSGVAVYDSLSRSLGSMAVTESGDSARLVLADQLDEDGSIAAMEVRSGERVFMGIRGGWGKGWAELEQLPDGVAKISISDEAGPRIALASERKGNAGINLRDARSVLRVGIQDEPSGFGVFDGEAKLRGSLGLNSDGGAVLRIRDKNGIPVVELPSGKR